MTSAVTANGGEPSAMAPTASAARERTLCHVRHLQPNRQSQQKDSLITERRQSLSRTNALDGVNSIAYYSFGALTEETGAAASDRASQSPTAITAKRA